MSRPTRSARITKAPVPLTVPPITRSPGAFSTGIGSPVIIDSSTALVPLEDDAIDRDLLAGPHAQPIADRDLVERHVLFPPVVAKDPRRLRREPQQRPDRAARPAPGAQLQHLSQQHQRRDDRRRLEVHADLSAMAPERRGKRPGERAAATL